MARSIQAVDDPHAYINFIIDELGIDRMVALDRIAGLLVKDANWSNYVGNIMNWIDERIASGDV